MSRQSWSLLQRQIAPAQFFKTLHKTFYGRRRKHCAILDSKRLAWRCVPFPARGGALQLIRQRVSWPWCYASGGQRLAVCARDLRLSRLPAPFSSLQAGYVGVATIILQYSNYHTAFVIERFIHFKPRGYVFFPKHIWVLGFLFHRKLPLPSHVTLPFIKRYCQVGVL